MSNSYFNFTTGRMVAGENALAEDVNAGFDAVAAGFDKLPTPDATKFLAGAHNTTSGSAGNFVLAVTADSYFDCMAVSFKANHSNSGACTLNVGSLGAKSLVDGNGSALAVGDIVANSIYAARYNSTSDKFHLVGLSSGNAADAAVVAANIADVATIADNIDELLLVDDNATAAAGSASDASGYADDALTQAGLASDYADAAAASAANLPNATTAGADKILTTNAAGDGWSYMDKVAFGRKNMLINGGFDVWQDGTSSSYASEIYLADMWANWGGVNTPRTISRETFSPGQEDVPGATYFNRTVISAGVSGSTAVYFYQNVENLVRIAGRTVTLSFYAKADAPKQVAVMFSSYYGSGGSPSSPDVWYSDTGVVLSSSWERKTVTIAVPSLYGKTLGTDMNSYLRVSFFLSDDVFNHTDNVPTEQLGTFDFANIQLEFGDTATDFEYRHPAEELALCQRYYERGISSTPKIFNQLTSTSARSQAIQYKVTKRVTPTCVVGSFTPSGHDGTPGALTVATTTDEFIAIAAWTGGTPGRAFSGLFTWTADARL